MKLRLTYFSVFGWLLVVVGLCLAWMLDNRPRTDTNMFLTMAAGAAAGLGAAVCIVDAWIAVITWFNNKQAKHRR